MTDLDMFNAVETALSARMTALVNLALTNANYIAAQNAVNSAPNPPGPTPAQLATLASTFAAYMNAQTSASNALLSFQGARDALVSSWNMRAGA